jgi:hypothetical protein
LIGLISEAKDEALFLVLESLILIIKVFTMVYLDQNLPKSFVVQVDQDASASYVELIAAPVFDVWMSCLDNYTGL